MVESQQKLSNVYCKSDTLTQNLMRKNIQPENACSLATQLIIFVGNCSHTTSFSVNLKIILLAYIYIYHEHFARQYRIVGNFVIKKLNDHFFHQYNVVHFLEFLRVELFLSTTKLSTKYEVYFLQQRSQIFLDTTFDDRTATPKFFFTGQLFKILIVTSSLSFNNS